MALLKKIGDIIRKNSLKSNEEEKDSFHYIAFGKVDHVQGTINTGHWTPEEHKLFLEALKIYGKDWDKIQAHIGTRNVKQIRSHAQKYKDKLQDEAAEIIKQKAKHEGKRTRRKRKSKEETSNQKQEGPNVEQEDSSSEENEQQPVKFKPEMKLLQLPKEVPSGLPQQLCPEEFLENQDQVSMIEELKSIAYSFNRKSPLGLSPGTGANLSGGAHPSNSIMSHESHNNQKFGTLPLFGSDMKINKLIKKHKCYNGSGSSISNEFKSDQCMKSGSTSEKGKKQRKMNDEDFANCFKSGQIYDLQASKNYDQVMNDD